MARVQDAEGVENNKLAEETKANCARRLHNSARPCSVLEIAVSLQLSPTLLVEIEQGTLRLFTHVFTGEHLGLDVVVFLPFVAPMYCFPPPPLCWKKTPDIQPVYRLPI